MERFAESRQSLPFIESASSLAFYLNTLRTNLDQKRQAVLQDVDNIAEWINEPPDAIIEDVKNCRKHIERDRDHTPEEAAYFESLKGCVHCKFMDNIEAYSKCIFIEQQKADLGPKKTKQGKKSTRQKLSEANRKKKNKNVIVQRLPTTFQRLSQVVALWVRKYRREISTLLDTGELLSRSQAQIDWLELARKEVLLIREYLLNVHDDLGMRSELQDVLKCQELVTEYVEGMNPNLYIQRSAIPARQYDLKMRYASAKLNFQEHIKNLSYLVRLAKANNGKSNMHHMPRIY
eukprot:TRINITY_DN2616_c0_g1_i1.p1 TRINITY_DN2616_c0_g1~~TRINITY_DN2616_c0_g1_i1.p1  ORF type:complete len:319 (+),score=63.06 TRINITY_DN2616_c0_g1_i1:87-959(+)